MNESVQHEWEKVLADASSVYRILYPTELKLKPRADERRQSIHTNASEHPLP